jgi:amidohydrolase
MTVSSPASERPVPVVTLFAAVDALRPMVEDIALSLHQHPEIGLQEHYATDRLAGVLAAQGWPVERGIAGLTTAFRARVGDARPAIAFLAEYDALPGIGHGCGHNLIAGASMAAALACSVVLPPRTAEVSWLVVGTPAEESYGGKVAMADAGVFDSIDAALLAHPGRLNSVGGSSWASHPVELTFRGKPAHAGGAPQDGVNALDACVQAYLMIRNLRNQLRDDVRLAGVITHGGEVQNVIPEFAQMRFTVRCKEWRFIEQTLIPRVVACAEAAATANLATLEWRHHEMLFKECLTHPVLQELASGYFAAVGEALTPPPAGAGGGTTDVGAVTWTCPALQIGYRIGDARGHSREMAEATLTPYAIDQTLKAAKVMAATAAELALRPALLAAAHERLAAYRAGTAV